MLKAFIKFLMDAAAVILIISAIAVLILETGLLEALGDEATLVLFLNLILPSFCVYFGLFRSEGEDEEKWELTDYFNMLMWATGIMMVVHGAIGYTSHRPGSTASIAPLWQAGRESFIKGMTIYVIFYLTWVILYLVARKYKWKIPFSKTKRHSDRSILTIDRSTTPKVKPRKNVKKTYGATKRKRKK